MPSLKPEANTSKATKTRDKKTTEYIPLFQSPPFVKKKALPGGARPAGLLHKEITFLSSERLPAAARPPAGLPADCC
ncbi:hypothetical protein SDC9_94200 [bioreactor metagenome]|uniref:Uncharacterized protein n=1 Tax=bioreactor metagenome TaxID=1076179 RepID=A0A645A2S3_9ZZZZ